MKITRQGVGARLTTAGLVGLVGAALVAAGAAPGHASSTVKHPRALSHETAGSPGFVPDAARLFDSRSNVAGPSGPFMGFVPVTTTDDVPANAAVVLSIAAVRPTGSGYVTAYPDGSTAPATSNLNYLAGQTVAATAIVSVPSNGVVDVNVAGSPTNVIVDQVGYYNSGDFVATTSARIVDSRTGVGITTGAKTGTVSVAVPDEDGNGVVALNVLATQPTGVGNLGLVAGTSVLNYEKGTSTANLVFAKVTDGKVTLNINGPATQLVIDEDGYAPAGSVVTAASPVTRIADTRTTHTTLSGATTLVIPAALIPSGATAVLLNLTAFGAARPGYAVGYTSAEPPISELQYGGYARADLITVPLSPAGSNTVSLFFSAPTSAVVDFEGTVGTVQADA